MRISISIPDDIFESADALAERMDISRSRLYSMAVSEYMAKHRHADTTAKLDEVYTDESGGLNPAVRAAQRRSLVTGEPRSLKREGGYPDREELRDRDDLR